MKLKDNYTPLFKTIIQMLLAAIFVMMLFTITVVIQGCQLVTVNVEVAQRAILDKGDGTNDSYTKLGRNVGEKKGDDTEIDVTVPVLD